MNVVEVWLLVFLSAAPTRASDVHTIVVPVGEQYVLTMPCKLSRISVDARPPALQRIALGDASIADVKPIGNNQVLIIGGAEGKTTLLMWCTDGTRVSYLVSVPKSRTLKGDQPVEVKQWRETATLVDEHGAHDTTVTVVELPGSLNDVEQIISADGGVSYVGTDSAGMRVTINAVPYVPRRKPVADAEARDAGK